MKDYIKHIILKNFFVILILSGLSIYYCFDRIKGNHRLKTFSLNEIKENGIGDNRYLEVTNCYTLGSFVYHYNPDNPDYTSGIIFPAVTEDEYFACLNEGANIELNTVLLIKRSTNKFNPNCMQGEEHTCLDDLCADFTIRGMVLLGLDDIDDDDKELIQSLNYNISSNVIFLEEDKTPRGILLSVLMLAAGIFAAIIALYIFIKHQKETNPTRNA
ncbi:MAG: hypothetical protein LBE04_03960 [Prevotellaceae bacterium]|jgi:hypothetical protein|nr:hypothetical protein [Prevotellaceae bacterium]